MLVNARLFCAGLPIACALSVACSRPEPVRMPPSVSVTAPSAQFRGDAMRRGASRAVPRHPLRLAWRARAGAEVWGAAAVDGAGNATVPALNGGLLTFDRAGRLTARFDARGALWASPALARDGTVFAAGVDSHLYATRGGTLSWTRSLGNCVFSSPLLLPDGSVVVGSGDHRVHRMARDGSVRFATDVGAAVDASPSLTPSGHVVVGTRAGDVVTLDARGAIVSRVHVPPPVSSTAAVSIDGTVYVGTGAGLAALAAGRVRFLARIGPVASSPALAPAGGVVVGSNDGLVVALGPSGSLRWTFATNGPVLSSPTLAGDGTTFVGLHDGRLVRLDGSGHAIWHYQTGGPVVASPAIAADGTVIVGSRDGRVYAFR